MRKPDPVSLPKDSAGGFPKIKSKLLLIMSMCRLDPIVFFRLDPIVFSSRVTNQANIYRRNFVKSVGLIPVSLLFAFVFS
jgi:hypothetical protein